VIAKASIPVDLFNAGQVLACLGFLEAADVLLGNAEGGFDWHDEADVRFWLNARGDQNPFTVVLGFLAKARLRPYVPTGYVGQPSTKKRKVTVSNDDDATADDLLDGSDMFPGPEAGKMALPIRLVGCVDGEQRSIDIGHWADASSRNDFKLYAGNRSAASIAHAMLSGTRDTPKKNQVTGDVKTRGLSALWRELRQELEERPFDVLTPMGGSFNFDPRGAWTAIDAGYSPNDQGHGVAASPVVEILAAIGLEHARPDEYDTRQVRYAAWGCLLPPVLARPALAGGRMAVSLRIFRLTLHLSGKNKVVTFAQEETRP
jgi:CRISPR-associated protein Csx14